MLKVKDAVKTHVNKTQSNKMMWIISGIACFVASFGSLMGFPSPVNVAVAVLSGTNIIPAFIGALLSYIIQGSLDVGIVQLCSILVIAVVRVVLFNPVKNDNPVFLSLLTSGVMILFNSVMAVATPGDTYYIVMRMLSSLLSGCIVFAVKTVLQRRDDNGVFELGGINGVFGGIIYIIIVATLSAVPVPAVNLGRIAGTFCILCGVRKYRNAGGAVMGALTTCGVLLCNPLLAKNTLLLATSGLICGAFIQFGLLATVLSFLGISLISLVAIGVNGDTFFMFADLVIGSMLFIAVPVSVIKKATGRIMGMKNSVDYVGQTACSRLSFVSHTLSDIRSQITLVSAAIDRKSKDNDLKRQVCTALCSDCKMFEGCWKKNKDYTLGAFSRLEETALSYNGISSLDVDKNLPLCSNPDDMEYVFNELYKRLLAEKANSIHLKEMRQLVTEQLESMEDILSDLSYRVGQVRSVDSSLSAQIRDYFSHLGYPNAKTCVFVDENKTQRIEVFLTSSFKGDLLKLTTGVSSITDCDFDLPVITTVDNVTKILFTEQPRLDIKTGSFQASCSDNEYSGDTFDTVSLSTSERYVVLSDGMGTGKRAKLDSMFTVNLAVRLLKAGISVGTAHKLINSILRVKGWEESFATLDILRLDLCGGVAEFLKSGACVSYLYRDEAVKVIGRQSFPAGILPECIPDISGIKIFSGDYIIMTSDGVSENVIRNGMEILRKIKNINPQTLAQKIGEMSMKEYKGKNRDDISIVIVEIDDKNDAI
ncbi:MAG: SpoIIE family protein phosphatase [Ruminococcus sp.]|nr:SpoIIE family protein phosphatase [Ruminococcus sp.]